MTEKIPVDSWQCPHCKNVYGPTYMGISGYGVIMEKVTCLNIEMCINCEKKIQDWVKKNILKP